MNTVHAVKSPKKPSIPKGGGKHKLTSVHISRPRKGTGISVTSRHEPMNQERGDMYYPPNETEHHFDDHKKAGRHVAGLMKGMMGLPEDEESGVGEGMGEEESA